MRNTAAAKLFMWAVHLTAAVAGLAAGVWLFDYFS